MRIHSVPIFLLKNLYFAQPFLYRSFRPPLLSLINNLDNFIMLIFLAVNKTVDSINSAASLIDYLFLLLYLSPKLRDFPFKS